MVGFKLLKINISDVYMKESFLLNSFETYFGKFSQGIGVKYQCGDNLKTVFSVEQNIIFECQTPLIFVYPQEVEVYQMLINGGNSVMVIPPSHLSIPFLYWAKNEVVIQMGFSWKVDKEFMVELIESIS
jgi:hypothetical protein